MNAKYENHMETICKGKGCQNLSIISAGVSHPPRLLVTQWICDVANAHSIGMNVKYENYIWRQFAGGKMLASFCRERRLPESEQYQHRYISSPSLCLLVTRWICSILLISSEWMWIFYIKLQRQFQKSIGNLQGKRLPETSHLSSSSISASSPSVCSWPDESVGRTTHRWYHQPCLPRLKMFRAPKMD